MNNLTASEFDSRILESDLQASSAPSSDPAICQIPSNKGKKNASSKGRIGKLEYARQRTIYNLASVRHELPSKSLLVLGRTTLPFRVLVSEFDMNIRRVYLDDSIVIDFAIETYFAEGYSISYSSFSKVAFDGQWNFVIMRQAPTSMAIEQGANSILKRTSVPIYVDDLLLLATPSREDISL